MLSMAHLSPVREPNGPLPDLLARFLARVNYDMLVEQPQQLLLSPAEECSIGQNHAICHAMENHKPSFLGHGAEVQVLAINADA